MGPDLRHLKRVIVSLVALQVLGPVSASAECRVVTVSEAEQATFEQGLNATRQERGAAPLRQDDLLNTTAERYACLMAETGHFDHVGPDGSQPHERALSVGYRYCSFGENLAAGMRRLPEADEAWRNSEGHFANYLQPSARDYGIAAAISLSAPTPSGATGSFSGLADRFGGAVVGNGSGAPVYTTYWVMLVGSAGC